MSAFGLDIGSTSIKAIQLQKQGDKFSLLAAGITASPLPGLASDNDKGLQVAAEAIKKLITDTKITTQDVNISLPESLVYTRLISFPVLTDQEIASAISWQAEPYIPIPIDQASIDYQIVNRREPQANDPGGVDVLLVAAPKALVNKYLKVCNMAGLNIAGVESEMLALSRSLGLLGTAVLIADIGSSSTDLGIVKNGQLVVSRSVSTAGQVLTRAVSSGLSVPSERAEEYKKTYGLNTQLLEGKVKGVLDPVFKLIVDEINKTLQYYKTDVAKKDTVQDIILSGGTSGMAEVTMYLAKELGLEVIIGDPFAKVIKDDKTAKALLPWAPLYGIAVGLAQNI